MVKDFDWVFADVDQDVGIMLGTEETVADIDCNELVNHHSIDFHLVKLHSFTFNLGFFDFHFA